MLQDCLAKLGVLNFHNGYNSLLYGSHINTPCCPLPIRYSKGLSRTPYNKINIHIGGVYGDKKSAMERFCKNFERLPESVKSRLTVENDDKASMYSVKDLYDGVYKVIGIPIVFDYHHHRFNTGDLSEQQALELAMSTWGDIVPVVHYSESRNIEQKDDKIRPQAHSDYIIDYINTYENRVDITVEAKAKELAVLKYKQIHFEEEGLLGHA